MRWQDRITITPVVLSGKPGIKGTRITVEDVLEPRRLPFDSGPPDLDWQALRIEQRISAVWEMTKLCYAWNHDDPRALRLQRSVVHVQRPRR